MGVVGQVRRTDLPTIGNVEAKGPFSVRLPCASPALRPSIHCRRLAADRAGVWPSGDLGSRAVDGHGGRHGYHAGSVRQMIRRGLTIYGSLDCPWSYLASRRASLLEREGVRVDWRILEQSDRREARAAGTLPRLHRVRAQLDQAMTDLRHGERLPYRLPARLPRTSAAVLAYAAAYRAGRAGAVRSALFEALWVHGLDLDDTELVNLLVKEAWPDHEPADGEPVDRRQHLATVDQPEQELRRLRQRWRDEVSALPCDVLPVLVFDGRARLHGCHAVGWLGDELGRRGIDQDGAADKAIQHRRSGPEWLAQDSRDQR